MKKLGDFAAKVDKIFIHHECVDVLFFKKYLLPSV